MSVKKEKPGKSWKNILNWLEVIITLFMSGVFVYIIWTTIFQGKTFELTKTEFFQQIDRQISLGTLETVKDIEMIRLGVARDRNSDKLRLDDLEGLLAEYLTWMGLDKVSDKIKQVEKVQVIKNIIKDHASKKPYSILPQGDQLIAIELKESIESGNKEASLNRLESLAASLGTQITSAENKVERNWRWTITSILIGIAGVLATVLVSLLSRRIGLSSRFEGLHRRVDALWEGLLLREKNE